MPIRYYSQNVSIPFKKRSDISRWLKAVVVAEGHHCGDIQVIFCDDGYLLEKNLQFLNHDTFTDIITFDYSEEWEGVMRISGDIFISVDRVGENALKYGVSFREELSRVMVHGVLHLCGYGDKTRAQQKQMRSREDFYLPLSPETV